MEGNHIQAVEEVFAEPPVRHFLFQVFVGGGNHPRVHLDAAVASQGFDPLLLQHPQHLGLGAQAHIADLVQENRAPVGLLELADLIVGGAGEGSPPVAEELAFDQLVGDGGAVHFHQRLSGPQRAGMQSARHQFFPGAALPVDEHAPVGGRRQRQLLPQRLQGDAFPHDAVAGAELLAQLPVFLRQAQVFEGVAHQ